MASTGEFPVHPPVDAPVNPPVNPNAGVTTYDCDGTLKWVGQTADSFQTMKVIPGIETPTAKRMVDLNNSQQYTDLLSLCNEKIKSVPAWLTPYLFCSLAYLESHDQKWKELFLYYEQHTGPAYEDNKNCRQVSDFLRKYAPQP